MHVDPSLTVDVTEARGSDSAGLHTGLCQAAHYWVVTHFLHSNLGENGPHGDFFFFSNKLGHDLHKVGYLLRHRPSDSKCFVCRRE